MVKNTVHQHVGPKNCYRYAFERVSKITLTHILSACGLIDCPASVEEIAPLCLDISRAARVLTLLVFDWVITSLFVVLHKLCLAARCTFHIAPFIF
jgi:hypothetical protein